MMQNAAWKPSKKSVISKIRDKQNRDKQGLPVGMPFRFPHTSEILNKLISNNNSETVMTK